MASSAKILSSPTAAPQLESASPTDTGLPLPHAEGRETPKSPTTGHLSPPPLEGQTSPFPSPLRQHRRTPSSHREVKETLNARSEYTNSLDYGSQHHINQYIISDEIGRGSFGAVHLAVDQFGHEYAVKEFSKSRLRKRAKSHILRRPPSTRPSDPEGGLESMQARTANAFQRDQESGNPLWLIRGEIAIMKKLNHPNVVSLIEVLDDPDEDSLYMVLELCKKGVVMKVGLDETTDPYEPEQCRCWFRDLILGIEYLHAQGIVHRDIKPDNLLVTEDDVLKVVDFGVSEMFEKDTEMLTAKSAGSPAFLPPELCVAKHGDISGRAADIWSMGVSLYCFHYGKLPFVHSSVLELYNSIKNDPVDLQGCCDDNFTDLMRKLLEKDPKKRITMDEIREHPWVTNDGTDPLLSKEENTANMVEPPTEIEMKHAITHNIKNLLLVMTAVNKFKKLLLKRRPDLRGQFWARDIRITESPPECASPISIDTPKRPDPEVIHEEPASIDLQSVDKALSPSAGPQAEATATVEPLPHKKSSSSGSHTHSTHSHASTASREGSGERGHAHFLSEDEPLFLGIGPGGYDGNDTDDNDTARSDDFIAESPTAADFSIYDTAYEDEVKRIRTTSGHEVTVYLTRRVESKDTVKPEAGAVSRWKAVLDSK